MMHLQGTFLGQITEIKKREEKKIQTNITEISYLKYLQIQETILKKSKNDNKQENTTNNKEKPTKIIYENKNKKTRTRRTT